MNSHDPANLQYSLPYVESVHEDYEEYALALIEEEMKMVAPRHLKKIPPLKFRTPMMQKEYETSVDNNNKPNSKEQPTVSFQPKKIIKPTSIEEWNTTNAIGQAKSRFEAERIRSLILEAEKEEGVANWKDYIFHLDYSLEFLQKSVTAQAELVEEINYQRQQAQERQTGPELDQLNQDYQQALYRRNLLEHNIETLKRETHGNVDRKRTLDKI